MQTGLRKLRDKRRTTRRLRSHNKGCEEAAAKKAAEEAARAAATPVPGKDTDSDGLTDVEELLYGTNFRDPDSDEDTFLDGNEVFHRYHPLGVAPSTLIDTGAVKIFGDAGYAYECLLSVDMDAWFVARQFGRHVPVCTSGEYFRDVGGKRTPQKRWTIFCAAP